MMKAIHYDAEGDILSVTFTEAREQKHTGIELSDNIILYYNPETQKPLKLVLLSYRAMLQASAQAPILLNGLTSAPAEIRATVTTLLQRTPLTAFLKLGEIPDRTPLSSRLSEVFTPATLQMVAAG